MEGPLRGDGPRLVRIGLISDTHGFLDPRVPGLFDGVAHIVHAGDIGREGVVAELRAVAPVTAVAGNVDAGLGYQETEVVELGGRRVLVQHIVELDRPVRGWAERLAAAGAEVVVFGHTHRRQSEWIGGRLYVNPGSAGRSGPGQTRSVAVLELVGAGLEVRFYELGDREFRTGGWRGCR